MSETEDRPTGGRTVRETPDGQWEVVTFPDQKRLSLHATMVEAISALLTDLDGQQPATEGEETER